MQVSNKGYINHKQEYNKETDAFITGSMSFANGKDEQGNWKNGYIDVIAFRDMIWTFKQNLNKLVNITGSYRVQEWTGQDGQLHRKPQIIIETIDGVGGNSQSNNFQNRNNAQDGTFESPFGATNPMDISDDDLPF